MTGVVVQECSIYDLDLLQKNITKGIELLGGWSKFVSPGMKVLLKVNLISPKKSETAAVTHSEFVRALTRLLINQECTVWIGDSSGGTISGMSPTAKALIVSGLKNMADEEGAQIKNFDKEGVVEIRPHSNYVSRMYLAKPIFEADCVINLPKLKTHSAGIYTGAVKNLFGCIPGFIKSDYHRLAPNPADLGQIFVDVHEAVNVSLHIMDGVTAMQGEGPTAGEVYPARKILLSTDPLALDTVATAMLGMHINDIPILVTARDRRLGESDLNNIEIMGDYRSPPLLPNFKYPKKFYSSKIRDHAIKVKLIGFLKTRPRINSRLCKSCNMCIESCPVQAINQETKIIDYNKCIECMCCHELCMHQAVELKSDSVWADLFNRLYRGTSR